MRKQLIGVSYFLGASFPSLGKTARASQAHVLLLGATDPQARVTHGVHQNRGNLFCLYVIVIDLVLSCTLVLP